MYLDTSVLVAYYCPEPSSRRAEVLVRSVLAPYISDLTEVELLSALSRKTHVRELTMTDARRIGAEFAVHVHDNLFRRIAIERRHIETARDWMLRFESPLRTLDALHLAIASAEGLRLATFDRGLARAATSLGVPVAGVTSRMRG